MEIVTVSTIRCPECGFTHREDIPENSCLWFYTCLGCGNLLRPLEKDCCVFCSYGTRRRMQKNMGSADKIIRYILAAVFFYLYFTGAVTGSIGIILLILGIAFVVTSLVGFCGLYKILGISTCPAPKQ